MSIVCKTAQHIHSRQIYDIERSTFSDSYSMDNLQQCMHSDLYSGSMVAEKDGRVIGYIIATRVADEAEIQRIAVDVRYRNEGCGSMLLEQYISDCRQAGVICIYLEVRQSNTAAIRLYTHYGFEQVGVRRAYYPDNGEDAVLYTLTLVGR